ncbi:recombinase family protein [Fictibacillus fluitans]|uniref:Recombinase family protein n=1 Tax=Fictibacillus fluitans TaxID=3058422 RepID=A0ABT8HX87_9BACL|nr:recombinase family protein [Fictibacillus sp. NE201]MDN4525366.1 recombinase family protein [Fictibacillus sp. NE201]
MKVVVYIRVSTHEQVEEGYSIQAQKTRLQAYAVSQGWEIVHFYVDEGISAKDMNRPELMRMLRGVKEKAFDCVLVYRLDRLTRSVMDLHELINLFEKHDVKFKSATEIYDTTTATGRLFITLVAALAQWERENLGERVKFGMEEKAREGKWVNSMSPLGYDREGDHLVINTGEAAVVKEIFNQYTTNNLGISKLARMLNDRGIKTKTGNTFSQAPLKYILTNPIYIGTMRYNHRVNKKNYFEVENVAPPIIEPEVFEKAQLILGNRRTSHPRRATSPFIYSGVLKCHRCGKNLNGKYSISRGIESYAYYCPSKKVGKCDLPTISQNFVNARFRDLMAEWDISPDLEETLSGPANTKAQDQMEELKKEWKAIQSRKKKWQYAWVNELMTDSDFKSRMDEDNAKEKLILEELNGLEQIEAGPQVDLTEYLLELRDNWDVMSPQEQKQVIQMIVKEIKVDKVTTERIPSSIEFTNIEFY